MKSNVLIFIILLFSSFFFNACKKENLSNDISIIPKQHFSVNVINNKLVFPSVFDYEKAISYLGKIGDENLDLWEQSIGFISFRREIGLENDTLIKDAILGSLLNKDYEIVIEGFNFVLDLKTEQVKVIPYDNNLKSVSDTVIFSTKINVIDKVFYPDVLESTEENAFKSTMEDKVGPYYWDVSTGQQVEFKVVYQAAGIYFSLQSKIKHQNHVGCNGWIEIGLNVRPGCKYKPKNEKEEDIPEHAEGGFCREYNYRPYQAMRRLDKYYFDVLFYYNDIMYGRSNSSIIGIKKGY